MVEVGLLNRSDRVELINGEIIHLSLTGSHHFSIVARLDKHFQ